MLNTGDSIKFWGTPLLRQLGSNLLATETDWNLSFRKEDNHYKQCLLLTIHGVIYHESMVSKPAEMSSKTLAIAFSLPCSHCRSVTKYQVRLMLVIISIDIDFVLLIKNGHGSGPQVTRPKSNVCKSIFILDCHWYRGKDNKPHLSSRLISHHIIVTHFSPHNRNRISPWLMVAQKVGILSYCSTGKSGIICSLGSLYFEV